MMLASKFLAILFFIPARLVPAVLAEPSLVYQNDASVGNISRIYPEYEEENKYPVLFDDRQPTCRNFPLVECEESKNKVMLVTKLVSTGLAVASFFFLTPVGGLVVVILGHMVDASNVLTDFMNCENGKAIELEIEDVKRIFEIMYKEAVYKKASDAFRHFSNELKDLPNDWGKIPYSSLLGVQISGRTAASKALEVPILGAKIIGLFALQINTLDMGLLIKAPTKPDCQFRAKSVLRNLQEYNETIIKGQTMFERDKNIDWKCKIVDKGERCKNSKRKLWAQCERSSENLNYIWKEEHCALHHRHFGLHGHYYHGRYNWHVFYPSESGVRQRAKDGYEKMYNDWWFGEKEQEDGAKFYHDQLSKLLNGYQESKRHNK